MIPKRNIVQANLISFLDPADNRCYSKGTVLYDIAPSVKSNGVKVETTAPGYGYDAVAPVFCTIAPEPLVPDPFGGPRTYHLQDTASLTTTHYIRQDWSFGGNNSYTYPGYSLRQVYTHSIYVKRAAGAGTGARNVAISITNFAGITLYFNFDTLALTDSDPTKVVTKGYESMGGGWYRIWLTHPVGTATSSYSSITARIFIYLTDSTGSLSYPCGGGSGIYFYGHMYQPGFLNKYQQAIEDTYGPYTSNRQNTFKTRQMVPNGSVPGYLPGPPSTYFSEENGGVLRYDDIDSSGARRGLDSYYSPATWTPPTYTGSFTAFAWIKLDPTANPLNSGGASGSYCVLQGSIGGKSNNNNFQVKKDGATIRFDGRYRVGGGAGVWGQAVESDAFMKLSNEWAFVTMRYTAGNPPTIRFYVNGVPVGTDKSPTSPYPFLGIDSAISNGIYTGWQINGSISWGQFKGEMGICGVYTSALTDAQILYNYEVTRYRYPSTERSNLVLNLDANNTLSYPGTGTAWTDLTGNAINGTITGATYSTDGGGCFNFNGTSNYVTLVDSPLVRNNANVSMSAWVKFTSTAGTQSIINKGSQGGTSNYFWLHYTYYNSGNYGIWWEFGDGAGNYLQYKYTWTPVIGQWYNIVVTFEPGSPKIYIDGQLTQGAIYNSSPTLPTFIAANTVSASVPFVIGTYRNNVAYGFPGKINAPLFYQKTLSSGEVLENYNAVKDRYSNPLLQLDASLTQSYPGTGTTWTDISGNGNNVTLLPALSPPTFDSANGGSIVFDGAVNGDYGSFTNQAALAIPTFTICSWVNPVSWNTNGTVVFANEYARLNLGIYYGATPGAYFLVRGNNYPINGSQLTGIVQPYSFALGTWYHVAYVVDIPGKNYRMYVNGSLIWSSNIDLGTTFQETGPQGMAMAARYGGASTGPSNIKIGTFYFFGKVLTAGQILQNYEDTRSRFP
jgi:hypothetical protein